MADDIDRLPPEWLSDTPNNEDTDQFSLLRAIAEDEETGLIEIAPQVWYQPKLRPDRDKLS